MKILWLLPLLPYPPDTGGKQDPYYMMREFHALGDQITAGLIYVGDKPDVPEEFSKLLLDLVWFQGNPKKMQSQLISSLGDSLPFKFRKYYSEDGVNVIADTLERSGPYDAVIIDHLHLGQAALDAREKLKVKAIDCPPLVLRTPNVESNIVTKYAERMPNPLVKIFAQKESVKMKAYEAEVMSEFDIVAAISPVDRDLFTKMSKKDANIISITAGVDIDQIKPSDEPVTEGEVAFVGTFDWQPNVDGATWMVKEVWPKVLEAVPGAHLKLVGRKPPPYLEELASDSVTVTGWVDSVDEYVRQAACIAVPLWIGSGMRLKILEAFAHGKAVVSTSLGAEGIECADGADILLRDEPGEFAEAIIEILSDKCKREEIGANARALAEKKYSWTKVSSELRDAIISLTVDA